MREFLKIKNNQRWFKITHDHGTGGPYSFEFCNSTQMIWVMSGREDLSGAFVTKAAEIVAGRGPGTQDRRRGDGPGQAAQRLVLERYRTGQLITLAP